MGVILTDLLAAASPVSSGGPLARTGELVKDKSGSALAEYEFAVGAFVVILAVGGVLVLEVSVLAGALNASGLGRLCRV